MVREGNHEYYALLPVVTIRPVFGVTDTARRPSLGDTAVYLLAVAGLAMSLTLIFLSMRAVLDIGGACADGGPFVPRQSCPDGVPLLITGGVFGLFIFGGLMAWRGSRIGGSHGALVLLAWPALFLSLGWNFLEYAIWPPGPDFGIVWGWLIPGLIFLAMGAGPLLMLLPSGGGASSGTGTARTTRAQRAKLLGDIVRLRDAKASDTSLLSQLERLSALRRDGTLTELEFEQAKRRIIAGGEGS